MKSFRCSPLQIEKTLNPISTEKMYPQGIHEDPIPSNLNNGYRIPMKFDADSIRNDRIYKSD